MRFAGLAIGVLSLLVSSYASGQDPMPGNGSDELKFNPPDTGLLTRMGTVAHECQWVRVRGAA